MSEHQIELKPWVCKSCGETLGYVHGYGVELIGKYKGCTLIIGSVECPACGEAQRFVGKQYDVLMAQRQKLMRLKL